MVGRRGEAWNDEDVAALRAMAQHGHTLIYIARHLERTPEAVLARAKRLKLELRRD